jgi:hypothetical protein
MTDAVGVLDPLAARVLARYPFEFTVPVAAEDQVPCYRIRYSAVVEHGWTQDEQGVEGLECDAYDDHAIHILGWLDGVPVCTGRLVTPPHPLPTEQECRLTVEPRGQVVDVGRMCVASDYQTYRHAAFIALLCRLYLEMRNQGYEVACGMMSPRARSLVRQLGVRIETLADDRPYWGEERAPVRFELTANVESLDGRWADPS